MFSAHLSTPVLPEKVYVGGDTVLPVFHVVHSIQFPGMFDFVVSYFFMVGVNKYTILLHLKNKKARAVGC